ncbi:MAG: MoxR family ATPase [Oscillatoria sp. PMC 1068.18]|nr:MoxR family ATPase [Oscillatoria sp. PMC 1076.18]MEC4988863.1 MoxR family ATPase [Oscillatoria sp. PMC 1068.18]
MNEPLEYEGKIQPKPGQRNAKGQILYPYIPSPELKEAVNLAIQLERPLLLEGEPGCGKTRLAQAIAYEFTEKYLKPQNFPTEWSYHPWYIKSDSRARDGLYRYDAVGRLRDAQLIGIAPTELREYLDQIEFQKLIGRLKNRKKYRTWGALGEALRETAHRPIVLIDEIDKADVDFPNDLLRELEELRFDVPETEEVIPENSETAKSPIVIITSNREKPLPDAFLRRCIYFYVEFPDEDRLLEIAEKRFSEWTEAQDELVDETIARFVEVREIIEKRPGGKPPGTSEFLEFMTILLNKDVSEAIQDLRQLATRLPLLGILLKTREDQEFFQENDDRVNSDD